MYVTRMIHYFIMIFPGYMFFIWLCLIYKYMHIYLAKSNILIQIYTWKQSWNMVVTIYHRQNQYNIKESWKVVYNIQVQNMTWMWHCLCWHMTNDWETHTTLLYGKSKRCMFSDWQRGPHEIFIIQLNLCFVSWYTKGKYILIWYTCHSVL